MKIIALILLLSSFALSQDIIIKDPSLVKSEIDAGGRRGSDGKNGRKGRDGRCSSSDSKADRGRNGENGEDGKNGSSGDDVLIYYTDIKDLKEISIYARGGSGGKGGKGGRGGDGCNGGRDGSDGSQGKDGSYGSRGALYIINKPNIFQRDINHHKSDIKSLVNKPTILRRSIWSALSGATNIISKRSLVENIYYSFKTVKERKVQVIWDSHKDIEKYLSVGIQLEFNGYELDVSFKDAFANYEIEKTKEKSLIIIKNIFKKNELLDFDSFEMSGQNNNLRLKYKYKLDDLDINSVKFSAQIHKKKVLGRDYQQVFYIKGGNKYISINDKTLTFRVGQLGFKNKFKKRKKKILIKLKVQLTVFNMTLSRHFDIYHKIGTKGTQVKEY